MPEKRRASKYAAPDTWLCTTQFRRNLLDPATARKFRGSGAGRGAGRVPPIRAANAFGFVSACDLRHSRFVRSPAGARGQRWRVKDDCRRRSDFRVFERGSRRHAAAAKAVRVFWRRRAGNADEQRHVYSEIRNKVKIQKLPVFQTIRKNAFEMGSCEPRRRSGVRAMTALVVTYWYPASYQWQRGDRVAARWEIVTIEKGQGPSAS